jgi:hypothetical protein
MASEEPLSASRTDVGRRSGVPIAQFCKEGTSCPTAGCRYVHGDTIPKINEPCKFGAECGAGNAAKKAVCLRMHPGEVYHPGMVVQRPESAASPAINRKGDLILIDGISYVIQNGNVYSSGDSGVYLGRLAIDRSAAEIAAVGGRRPRKTHRRHRSRYRL